jgi:transcriptional regulator with XRE-family HTH domain
MVTIEFRATKAQRVKFGQAVRERRKKMSMLQKDLAEKAGVSLNQVSNIELGTNHPSLQTYFSICRVLDMPKPPFAP